MSTPVIGGPAAPREITVKRGHFIPATEPPKDVFEARRRGKSKGGVLSTANVAVRTEAEWVIKSPHLGISLNDAGFVRKVAHGSEVENKIFEGDRIRSINGTKVATKLQAYALIDAVEAGADICLAINIDQRETRQRLAYVDFFPEEDEADLAALLYRVNKTVEEWQIKVFSIETMMAAGSIANREATRFMMGINVDKDGNKSYGGRGVFYQFFRVWYNVADPANRVPTVQQNTAKLEEAADAAVETLDTKEAPPCLVM